MSGWERYVEQGTRAVMAANYMAADEITEGLVRADVQVALAAVGPLIQEDTRDRMVTAAAAALLRDGSGETIALAVLLRLSERSTDGRLRDAIARVRSALHDEVEARL